MNVSRVRQFLADRGFTGTVLEFAESSATVELAAEQVGTTPPRIAKTVSFVDPENADQTVLIVAAGDVKINGGRFKRHFGSKPRMLTREQVEPLTGYPIGGVCPFANPSSARVFLDESLRRFESVFPAAGSDTSAVEMTLDELERFSNAEGWVEVTTPSAATPVRQ